MKDDPVVRQVREAREAYAARFGFDLRAIGEDLRRLTEQAARSGHRVAECPPRPAKPRRLAKKAAG